LGRKNFLETTFTPRIYYREAGDFIQGVPAISMAVNAISANDNLYRIAPASLLAELLYEGIDSYALTNLFDEDYVDHLTGFNRIIDSNVPSGSRLPGTGRNLFTRIQFQW